MFEYPRRGTKFISEWKNKDILRNISAIPIGSSNFPSNTHNTSGSLYGYESKCMTGLECSHLSGHDVVMYTKNVSLPRRSPTQPS